MKKRILSIVLMLALAFSLAIGTAVISNAAAGDASIALNLAENITVQVKFESWADAAASAVVQIDERTPATVIPVKDGYDAIVEIPVPVKDLDADVKVTLYTADGIVLAEKTVNAAEYCESLADDATYGALVKSLKAYSAVAKSYFANDGTLVAPDVAPDFGESTYKTEGTLPAGLTHDSATLILESETTIRHYFLLADDYSIGSYRFWVDLDEDGGFDVDEQLTVVNAGDAYYVDISGITPNDLDKAYTIYVTDYNDTYSCTYGALDYAARKYESGEADAKALTAALNNYLAEAAKIGANVVYMDGETELKTELYNYGVDNYISYAPEKDGSYFGGWVDAEGKKVNVIADGTVGDVTLYAKWESAPATPTISADQASIITGFTNLIKADTVTAGDGYTSFSASSFDASGNLTFGTFNNKELPVAISAAMSAAGVNYNYVKASMEFGMVDGCANAVPIAGRFSAEQTFFGIGTDGSVYLGGVPGNSWSVTPADSGDTYKIAQLKAGELTKVEFYVDITGSSLTPNTRANIVLRATNLAGEEVSLSISANWTATRNGIAQWRTNSSLGSSIAGQSAGLLVGDFEWAAVPTMGEYNPNNITDATTGSIYAYEAAQATRLPSNIALANKAFAGWYADAECTQAINSIEKGNFGTLTVYSKWADADYYASAKNANGNHIKGDGYGDIIEEYNMCYTYTVRFDKNSSTDVSGQIRLRNSGLEEIVDEEGNVTYRDWAKYYQYYSTDPTRAGLGNVGNKYVGDVFDGILSELGIELRAKDENGEYIMDTYTVTEKKTVTELQPKLDEETGEPVIDEATGEPVMEEVEVEKEVEVAYPCHKIDEAAFELYYSKIMSYSPNSNLISAIRYANGVVKTMNYKVLANVTKEDAIISFVVDFANLELRYYLNGIYFTTEKLTARTPDTPFDKDNYNYNVFLDANGGLSNYNSYKSAEPFNFLNWQNTSGATLATEAFTFGDIYDTTASIKYELNGGAIEGEAIDEIAIGAELVLPENVTKDNCVFSGWFLDASFETPADGYVVPNSKNITVYAKLVELVTYNITYSAGDATIADASYSTSFIPGYTDVVLPVSVAKEGSVFVGWFMDEALTVRATDSALAECKADTTLYAKFVTNTVAATKPCNGAQQNSMVAASSGHLNVEGTDKAITLRLVLDAVDVTETDVGANMRVRPYTGGKEVYVAKYNSGVYKTGTSFWGGAAVYTLGSGDQVLATNSADKQTVIDIVMNFADNTVTYYVDNIKVAHVTNAGFQALDQYDCTGTYPFWQWHGTSMYHTVYTIYGDIHHLDSDGNHFCDDCEVRLTDCVDAAGDGEHNCDVCGAEDASPCVDEDNNVVCDECGLTMSRTQITYNANGGTLPEGGYTTEFIPGVTKVVLPNATKDGEILAGWYLDEALTQKATAEALAAATADVTLYAKYATAYWTKAGTTAVSEYWYQNGNIGTDMINAGVNTLTLRIDTATSGSVDWSGVGTNDGEPTYIRLRTGITTTGAAEWKVAYFFDGYITTTTGERTKLVAIDSGDVLNIVINFTNKTADYYVNGAFVCKVTGIGVNSDLTYYNYVNAGRDNMFQLGAGNGTDRKLGYDGVQILFGEVCF